jgi:hypothetical protein
MLRHRVCPLKLIGAQVKGARVEFLESSVSGAASSCPK